MRQFKFLALILIILTVASISNSQTNEILAMANGQNYTVQDLEPATREAFEGLGKSLANQRTEELGEQIAEMLFAEEANALKITSAKLLETEIPKRLTAPTAAEIKAVYDANRDQIGNRTLEEMRPQIINFLQRDSYPKALFKYVGELKLKHKVLMGKDVNTPNLLATDVLATVNLKPLTVKDFEQKAGQHLYELRMAVYEKTLNYLELMILSDLTRVEAKKLDLSPESLIAREISDKLRDFSDEEREKLTDEFNSKLWQKYNVKILLKEPTVFVHKVSTDDDPAQGSATAPVTVVMFSDFQCPACAATHPVLKKVMAEYPAGKIRFVVRDFPLKQLHKEAFQAAQAANAAHAQGKFFEYIELLYGNQDSLDTDNLKKFAAQIGLNLPKFEADLKSGKFNAEIEKDISDGENYDVHSTPTIFINGVKLRSLSAKAFKKEIERWLK
jgi:protein-disulfide isomerase